jgi:CubicO group peptidase (beta-lactamase class C family)
MKAKTCSIAVSIWLLQLLAAPQVVADDRDQRIINSTDALMEELHERGLFNGAIVLGREGEEVYARGFGPANVESGVAFTPDTPADGASMAKTLAAAAVLMLEVEGKLHLDDPVSKYVPEYPHAGTRVWHLIAHSAGLPEYDFFDLFIPEDEVRTTSEFLRLLNEHAFAPAFEPGTRFRYCNLCYDVAALLVERITNMRWDEFLRERIFTALEMESTFLRPARLADWAGVRTLSYRQLGDGLAVWDVWDNEGFYGGSGLYFSARDLYRWSRSFYTQPVLSDAVLSLGREPPTIHDPLTGARSRSAINLLSWYYSDEGRRYHFSGAWRGFWSNVYRDEDQRYSVVYISNNDMPKWMRPLLTRALIDVMEGRDPAPIDRPNYADLDVGAVDAITGTYNVTGIGTVTISAGDGRAWLRVGSGIEYPLYFVGQGELYVPDLDVRIGFRDTPADPLRHLDWLSVFQVTEGERAQTQPMDVATQGATVVDVTDGSLRADHSGGYDCLTATTLSERLQFARIDRAREILGRSDEWARQLSAFDRGARQRILEPTSTRDFLEFISGAAAAWTDDEIIYWQSLIDQLGAAMEGMNLLLPDTWMVKTTGLEEFNAVYVRNRSIILPEWRIDIPRDVPRDFFLLAHELFHLLSLESPTWRDELYALLGFRRFPGFEFPAELEERRLSNPMYGARHEYAVTVQTDSGPAEVIPVYQAAVPLEEFIAISEQGMKALFEAVDFVLLPVDIGTGTVLRDDRGKPVVYKFEDTDWVDRMQRNSSYIIHPDELLADNFALLMEWRRSGNVPEAVPGGPGQGFRVNDLELLREIEKVLTAGCERSNDP